MKNKFALLALLVLFLVGSYNVYAQDADTIATEEVVEETAAAEEEAPAVIEETTTEAPTEESASFHQIIKQKFHL